MASDNEIKASRGKRNPVPDAWERDIRQRLAFVDLVQLDILPAPCRRKRRYESWVGFALFLPPFLFVLRNLFTG